MIETVSTVASLFVIVLGVLLLLAPVLIWMRQEAVRSDQAKQRCYLQERTEQRLAAILEELKQVNTRLDRLTVVDDDGDQ